MTILVKEVTIINIAGASDKTVSKKSIWRLVETSCGLLACPSPISTLGIVRVCATAAELHTK
jgi:hypothetical protein